ncbi:putative C-terminal domain protein [Golden Marseillevirus]|uniref:putative C-terminal domain protein n=1 Tax=Golden Marseillevirus TaxID=1720526 RepID=UPI000877AD4F|nr:putative C-terminal domain protein [Golden Marseillevirus]ALX27521.1 putative C-terminal domain protein [Golden Marseillevirus]
MADENPAQPKKYSVIINCLPRTVPLVSKKQDFGDLGNLYLDMIEVKEKLRPGLPLVPVVKVQKKEEAKPEVEPVVVKPAIVAAPAVVEAVAQPQPETKEEEGELLFLDDDADADDEVDNLLEDEAKKENNPPQEIPEEKNIPEDDESSESEDEEEMPADPIVEEDDGLTEEQKEEKEKDELLWKFKILKKKHPQHLDTIPDFDEHSDIVTMRRKYQMTVKELHMESKLFEYRKYAFFGGCIFEGLCTNFLGLDLEGFSQVQDVHGYDALLVELGEKSYTNFTSYLPVEIRLVIAFAVNVAIFYIFKTMSLRVTSEDLFTMISQVGGDKIADFLRGATGKTKEKKKEEPSAPQKKKMRGPTIRAEDVRKMSLEKED